MRRSLLAGALRLTVTAIVALCGTTGSPAAERDGFDPGVIDPRTGEPTRRPPGMAARTPAGRAGETGHKLEEGEAQYARWRWFWGHRADHTGTLAEDTRWQYFLGERTRRMASTAVAPAAQWTTLGPTTMQGIGGRMLCFAFHPTQPETLYAGSNSGGLWWSRNGGLAWEPLTDQLPAMSVSSVAVNPSSPNEILIGTGHGWFLTESAYSGVGVLRSTDGGLTWGTTTYSFPISSGVGTFDLAWDPQQSGRVYLAANTGFHRSSDGGVTWQQRLAGFCTAVVVHPQNADTVYAALGGDGIYRSHDGGETFAKLTTGLPAGSETYLFGMAICRTRPNVLYTTITQSNTFCLRGLYKSTDRGDSWVRLDMTPDVTTAPGYPACFGWIFNTVAVAPANPDIALVGGIRVFRTANGGATYTQRDYLVQVPSMNPTAGYLYVDNFAFGFHPTNVNAVYAFNDGGVWRSSNSGLTWLPRSEGLMTGLVYKIASSPLRPDIVVAGTQDHGLQRVDHAGGNLRWTRWTVGDGGVVNIDPTNDQIVYGVRDVGSHVKSLDGASTYAINGTPITTGITEASNWLGPQVMDPVDPEVLWTASVARIYKTTDGGALWQPMANIPNVMTIAVDHLDPRIVYAHAYDNSTWQLWRTTDGGAVWTQLTDPSIPGWRVTDLETDPTRTGVVYATRNSGFAGQDHVKRSTDFGVTWTNLTANLPDVITSAIAASPENPDHLYLATDLGVFLSTDGGAAWDEWNDGLPLVYASDIHYLAADRTVRVATLGRGVWRSPAYDVLVGVDPVRDAPPRRAPSVMPNPSRGTARIRFSLEREGPVAVSVFDITGQRVRALRGGTAGAGDHELAWDGRDDRGRAVAAGVYFVRVVSAGRGRSVRILRL